MSRLVDVDKLISSLNGIIESGMTGNKVKACLKLAIQIADAQPTVDADAVKHGHWIIEDIYTYERSYGGTLYEPVYKCSCCGRVTESYVRGDEPIMPEDADFPEFCGNCGAKMDEVEDEMAVTHYADNKPIQTIAIDERQEDGIT